ncbi:glycosyltransferase family 4 protein [Tianweitania sediminis]|uniref:Glycosyltransferase family 4 protein n=1 Tax=Tianweitania sediminis TaxID=1502156 RepID=A0A8J7R1H6_9HYPH|nr:glycosyltransferase family 4 protein [Tianweitania sediminis]MBP0439622.1 glycosyltransferase family 4 protein [Tianweitania sediminis]
MSGSRLLFVNHVSTMSGAEYVLAEVAKGFPGASAFLFEQGPLVSALQASGLQISIARNGSGLNDIRRDRSLLRALPSGGRLLALIMEIARAARRHDVLYANSQKAFLLTALAASIVRRPLIWHLHDILDEAHFGGAQRKLQIALANRLATRVIVPSTACAEAFVQAGGRPDLPTVIPNGIASTTLKRLSRAELGLPEGPLVGVFSRLARWKGQHVLLQALKDTSGIGAVFVGSPLFGEDAYEAELHREVEQLGLSERVIFLGQRNDVLSLMAAIDCVVHPSIYAEPFGLTIVEGMAVGTPVIAADAGAAREILADGGAGRLVRPGDPQALAQAINAFFAAPGEFAKQTADAAERAAQLYTADRMRGSIRAMLASVTGKVAA